MMKLENILPSEKTRRENMFLFMWNVKNRPTYRDKVDERLPKAGGWEFEGEGQRVWEGQMF